MTYDKDEVKCANPLDAFAREVLGEGKRVSAKEWAFRCPWHNDTKPSLHVDAAKAGGVFLCRACGAKGDLFTLAEKVWGVSFPEALERLARRGGVVGRSNGDAPSHVEETHGLATVAGLAAAKGLPESFLRELGWTDLPRGGVKIPYADETGAEGSRWRIRHHIVANGDRPKSTWGGPTGEPILAYGLSRLADARRCGRLLIGEGETDAATGL